MALGLFERQRAIGLAVPHWATIFVGRCESGEDAREEIKEFVGGLATAGCPGATLVFGPGQEFEWHGKAMRDWAASGGNGNTAVFDNSGAALSETRPHFRLVSCDRIYYRNHAADVDPEGSRAIYLAGSAPPHGALAEAPGGFGGEAGAICLDLLTGAVGQSASPHLMLQAARDAEWEGPKPHERGNWSDAPSRRLARTAAGLMAINWLCKPGIYRAESFMYIQDFLDEVTARCFNDRNLRPRWQGAPPRARKPQQGESRPRES